MSADLAELFVVVQIPIFLCTDVAAIVALVAFVAHALRSFDTTDVALGSQSTALHLF